MPVAFDTSGMEQYDERTWFDPRTGDQASLTYIGLVPDLPAGLDDLPRLRRELALETAEVGALIEAHLVYIDKVPALYQLLKVPIPDQDSGQAFIAAFTLPKATCSAVLRIQCAEGPRTGVREAKVFDKVGPEGYVRPHPYAPELTGRLPWHVADDVQWDPQFPDHPLSRARAWAHRTMATATVDPAFAKLPPFRPAAAPGAEDPTETVPRLRPLAPFRPDEGGGADRNGRGGGEERRNGHPLGEESSPSFEPVEPPSLVDSSGTFQLPDLVEDGEPRPEPPGAGAVRPPNGTHGPAGPVGREPGPAPGDAVGGGHEVATPGTWPKPGPGDVDSRRAEPAPEPTGGFLPPEVERDATSGRGVRQPDPAGEAGGFGPSRPLPTSENWGGFLPPQPAPNPEAPGAFRPPQPDPRPEPSGRFHPPQPEPNPTTSDAVRPPQPDSAPATPAAFHPPQPEPAPKAPAAFHPPQPEPAPETPGSFHATQPEPAPTTSGALRPPQPDSAPETPAAFHPPQPEPAPETASGFQPPRTEPASSGPHPAAAATGGGPDAEADPEPAGNHRQPEPDPEPPGGFHPFRSDPPVAAETPEPAPAPRNDPEPPTTARHSSDPAPAPATAPDHPEPARAEEDPEPTADPPPPDEPEPDPVHTAPPSADRPDAPTPKQPSGSWTVPPAEPLRLVESLPEPPAGSPTAEDEPPPPALPPEDPAEPPAEPAPVRPLRAAEPALPVRPSPLPAPQHHADPTEPPAEATDPPGAPVPPDPSTVPAPDEPVPPAAAPPPDATTDASRERPSDSSIWQVPTADATPEQEPEPPTEPATVDEVAHTVLVGLPIGDYLSIWHTGTPTYWRMSDPDAVRDRLGVGVESRVEIDDRRFREAAVLRPGEHSLFLADRFRDGDGHLTGTTTELLPATEDEARAAADDRAMSELYRWLGDVVLAAGERDEYVAVEPGGWSTRPSPFVLVTLRTNGEEWHSVVETSPVPVGAPVWRDQQPVDGDRQSLISPATDQTMRAAGLLTRFAVATWTVHPFELMLSFGPNPTLGVIPTR